MSEGVRIAQCNCKHEFQDQKYGKNMRVMNNAPAKGNSKSRYRCTVCNREHHLKEINTKNETT